MRSLAALLEGAEGRDDAHGKAQRILSDIAAVRMRQEQSGAVDVGVLKHIEAHAANVEALRSAKRSLVALENAAISAGHTLERLLGEAETPPATEVEPVKKAVIRLSIANPSPDIARGIDIHHELPRELAAGDIVDADGLSVGLDVERGRLFLREAGAVEAAW